MYTTIDYSVECGDVFLCHFTFGASTNATQSLILYGKHLKQFHISNQFQILSSFNIQHYVTQTVTLFNQMNVIRFSILK